MYRTYALARRSDASLDGPCRPPARLAHRRGVALQWDMDRWAKARTLTTTLAVPGDVGAEGCADARGAARSRWAGLGAASPVLGALMTLRCGRSPRPTTEVSAS
jgi:hypothetical protein